MIRFKCDTLGLEEGFNEQSLHAAQVATIELLARAINDGVDGIDGILDHNLAIWLPTSSIVHSPSGTRSTGFSGIIAHYEKIAKVFGQYTVKAIKMERAPGSHMAMVVTWKVEAYLTDRLNGNRSKNIIAPFSQSNKLCFGELLTFTMTSYLTFHGDKILQEVQVMDSLALLSTILTNHPQRCAVDVAKISKIFNLTKT